MKLYCLLAILSLCLTLVLADPFASNCGGNCPTSDCDSCPCGTAASPQDITTVCAEFAGWDQTCCKCIVQQESAGNANAVNETSDGRFTVGLFQIHTSTWKTCGNAAPCSVAQNVQCATDVWKNGGGSFKLWPTSCAKCGCCTKSTTVTHATVTHTTAATHATVAATHAAATHDSVAATHASAATPSTATTYTGGYYESEEKKSGGRGNVPIVDLNVIYKN